MAPLRCHFLLLRKLLGLFLQRPIPLLIDPFYIEAKGKFGMNKKKKKKKTHIPFRLNILFFIVFLLFSSLILKLGVVQIVFGENYKREIERTDNVIIKTSVPRGKIYDSEMRAVVDNEPVNAITYTRLKGTSQQEKLMVAEKLSGFIEKSIDDVRDRDIKDYYILTNNDEAYSLLSDEEKSVLSDTEAYDLVLERIDESIINKIKNDAKEMEILAIKRELDKGYNLTPQFIKKDNVTDEEYAVVSEHLEELPGVDTTTDWNRKHPYGDIFRAYLGNESQGLPSDQIYYYLSREYSRNDRVGKSYLEEQYEDVLTGQKEFIENITDKQGNLKERRVVRKGKQGNDVILTVDMELQKRVETIIEEELIKAKQNIPERTPLLDQAFVVMMNPNTGEVYSLAGKKMRIDKVGKPIRDEEGNYQFDFSLGATNNGYAMGSAVKGATVLSGFQSGVIEPGTYLVDQPIKIPATPIKKSYTNMGRINDLTALKRSSNVYMFRIAMAMGEYPYQYNQRVSFNNPNAFEEMRNYFSQFGLGVKTGIDLPVEATGYEGPIRKIGLLMDLAIGQYDLYTPLQMAQYISTIANGGYRMEPYLVKEIREPTNDPNNVGKVVHRFEPKVLNRIDMSTEYIDRVKEGFRQVFQEPNGTAYAQFNMKPYKPAGKTGTAEVYYYDDPESPYYRELFYNLTLVGYAPHDKPEVAFSVVVPYTYSEYSINKYIGSRILDAFFELKAKGVSNNSKPIE